MYEQWSSKGRLSGSLLEVGDEVVSVLGLLETAKGHLGARNVLLGVLEVLELVPFHVSVYPGQRSSERGPGVSVPPRTSCAYQGVLLPLDTLLLVGIGV